MGHIGILVVAVRRLSAIHGYAFIYRFVPARCHPRFGSLRPSSNRLPEPDLAAPLPSIEGTYSRCFLCLALSRRGLNYLRWALSRRGFRVTVGNRGDGNLRLHRADRAGAR